MAEYRQNSGYNEIISSTKNEDWREDEHPRDKDGKFTEKSGGQTLQGKLNSANIQLSKQEWAQYYRMIDNPQNKGAIFKAWNGKRLVRLNNKIVFDDGENVSRVLVFPNNDTMNDFINEMLDRGSLQWE